MLDDLEFDDSDSPAIGLVPPGISWEQVHDHIKIAHHSLLVPPPADGATSSRLHSAHVHHFTLRQTEHAVTRGGASWSPAGVLLFIQAVPGALRRRLEAG